MPIEFSLELLAENPVLFHLFTGYVSRDLLLHMLRQVDPSVSTSLHEPDKVKPYFVTPIRFRSKGHVGDKYILDETKPCSVRFRFLNDDLATVLLKYLCEGGNPLIYDVKFRTCLAALGTNYHYTFPDPVKVFMNLMRLWNSFSDGKRFGSEEQREYMDWPSKNVRVSKYRLETTIACMKEKKATGFTGWIEYDLGADDEWNNVT